MTQHQWDILLTVAEAGDQQMAADRLGLNISTIKNSLANIRFKTGTTTTLAAYHSLRD